MADNRDEETKSFLASLGAEDDVGVPTVIAYTPPAVIQDVDKVEVLAVDSDKATTETDFKTARDNIIAVSDTIRNSMTMAALIASQTQDPKLFEAAAKLAKTLLDAQNDLMALHGKREGKPAPEGSPSQQITHNDNSQTVFVGTPADLQRLRNQNKIIDQ